MILPLTLMVKTTRGAGSGEKTYWRFILNILSLRCLLDSYLYISWSFSLVPGMELLKPFNFPENRGARRIFGSNIWFWTMVPDTKLLILGNFLDDRRIFCLKEMTFVMLDRGLSPEKNKLWLKIWNFNQLLTSYD